MTRASTSTSCCGSTAAREAAGVASIASATTTNTMKNSDNLVAVRDGPNAILMSNLPPVFDLAVALAEKPCAPY